jgi:hypothetical protein
MLYILEAWVILHLWLHHRSRSAVFLAHIVSTVIIVVVIASTFVGEVARTFVFVCAAILKHSVSQTYPSHSCLPHLSYILEAVDDFVDI